MVVGAGRRGSVALDGVAGECRVLAVEWADNVAEHGDGGASETGNLMMPVVVYHAVVNGDVRAVLRDVCGGVLTDVVVGADGEVHWQVGQLLSYFCRIPVRLL